MLCYYDWYFIKLSTFILISCTLYVIECIYRLLCVYSCSAIRLRRKIKYLSIYLLKIRSTHGNAPFSAPSYNPMFCVLAGAWRGAGSEGRRQGKREGRWQGRPAAAEGAEGARKWEGIQGTQKDGSGWVRPEIGSPWLGLGSVWKGVTWALGLGLERTQHAEISY